MSRNPAADAGRLRLEVETAPSGLPNLVQNPSGEQGAWFYLTPVANTIMTSDGTRLSFKTTTSQAAYFTTDYMPVAATKYVAARLDLTSITASHNVKARFEFYTSAKVLVSTSAQTGALATIGTNYVPSVQAPANTAYVKLRLDFYNGTGNPNANATVLFNNVMVTWADTAAAIGSMRTNQIRNPSFEVGTTRWSAAGNCTIARSTTVGGFAGTAALRLTKTVAGQNGMTAAHSAVAVVGGSSYRVSCYSRAATTARYSLIVLSWLDSAGATLAINTGTAKRNATGAWTRHNITATAPSNAVTVGIYFTVGSGVEDDWPQDGEQHYLDAVLMESGTNLKPYFDGATPTAGGYTYAWSGTAHDSTSTETASSSAYDFTEPVLWQDIFGPAHEIKIMREGLNVGTLSAVIHDALLDPATAPTIRPGKRIRLTAEDDTAAINTLFTGKLDRADVLYDPRDTSNRRARITLSAVDAAAQAANVKQPNGVGTIAALPYILEGAGVPWNVNGSGSQVTAATVAAKNENASVLDQVAITRDSVLGYAWVSRSGVLTAFDATQMPAGVAATWGDADLSDLQRSFNTEDCINEVMIKWLRYNAAKGTTKEIVYGPYRDVASQAAWGPRAAEFTAQGTTETTASMQAYADAILAANATPQVRVNTVRIPINDTAAITPGKALIDLYDSVTLNPGTVNETSRVTSVEHSITASGWLVDVGFTSTSVVAAPTVTPSPQATNAEVSNAPQAGTAASGVVVAATSKVVTVTFPTPFASAPKVVLTGISSDPGVDRRVAVVPGSETTTTFQIAYWRATGTASFDANWIALVP